MTVQSIGDQARAFAMQAASNRIKTTLATLTDELSSGEVADLGARLQGNTQDLAKTISQMMQNQETAELIRRITRSIQK